MNSYGVVIAMLIVALAAVLVAAVRPDAPSARPARSSGPTLPVLAASDALGEGLAHPDHDHWVSRLAAQLPPEVTVHNLAVGGSILAAARRSQLPRLLDIDPDLVVCWLVVNDLAAGVSPANFERDLAGLLAEAGAPDRPVIVGNLPDLASVGALAGTAEQRQRLAAVVSDWNAMIARVAAQAESTVVDLASELVTADDLGPDGFHPSPAGHIRLASRFLPAVCTALGLTERTPLARP